MTPALPATLLPRALTLALALLLSALAPQAAAALDPDPCAGRNPLYCNPENEPEGAATEPATTKEEAEPAEPPNPDVLIDPPGGCRGRNPLYCRETQPEVKPKPPEPPSRERANDGSRNPNRNANRNPNQNPNRNPRRGRSSN